MVMRFFNTEDLRAVIERASPRLKAYESSPERIEHELEYRQTQLSRGTTPSAVLGEHSDKSPEEEVQQHVREELDKELKQNEVDRLHVDLAKFLACLRNAKDIFQNELVMEKSRLDELCKPDGCRPIVQRWLRQEAAVFAEALVKRRWQAVGVWNKEWDDEEGDRRPGKELHWSWKPNPEPRNANTVHRIVDDYRHSGRGAYAASVVENLPESWSATDLFQSEREAFIASRPWFVFSVECVAEELRRRRLPPTWQKGFTEPVEVWTRAQWIKLGVWKFDWDTMNPTYERKHMAGWTWEKEDVLPTELTNLNELGSAVKRKETAATLYRMLTEDPSEFEAMFPYLEPRTQAADFEASEAIDEKLMYQPPPREEWAQALSMASLSSDKGKTPSDGGDKTTAAAEDKENVPVTGSRLTVISRGGVQVTVRRSVRVEVALAKKQQKADTLAKLAIQAAREKSKKEPLVTLYTAPEQESHSPATLAYQPSVRKRSQPSRMQPRRGTKGRADSGSGTTTANASEQRHADSSSGNTTAKTSKKRRADSGPGNATAKASKKQKDDSCSGNATAKASKKRRRAR